MKNTPRNQGNDFLLSDPSQWTVDVLRVVLSGNIEATLRYAARQIKRSANLHAVQSAEVHSEATEFYV